MSAPPRISVLVPTRDRPDLVESCLASLSAQTFVDFEVVVADNPVAASCRDVVERLGDDRVRLVGPDHPISMADNWELALDAARGEHVGVLIDKSVLLPGALETAAEALDRDPVDIVTWWNEGFTPASDGDAEGWYEPYFEPGSEQHYDPREVLRRGLELGARRGTEGTSYFRSKICFGLFSRRLIEKIRSVQARVFFPIAPDYTSRAAGGWLAGSAIDLGRALMLSYRTARSNGVRYRTDAAYARQFLSETSPDGSLFDALPIPKLYASLHNLVAHDLSSTLRRVAAPDAPAVDAVRLAIRAAEDLDLVEVWADVAQEVEQRAVLDSAIDALPDGDRELVRSALAHRSRRRLVGSARELVRGLLRRHRVLRLMEARLRRPWAVPRRSSSILAATELAAARSAVG